MLQNRLRAQEIFRALGDDLIQQDVSDRYTRDWSGDHVGVAATVLRPRSAEQIAEILRLACQHRIPVVPQGGHTGLAGGATPSSTGNEVVISLERMNQVRELSSENHYMVAEAGCVLRVLQDKAAEANLCLPISLGSQESCQIGGNVSTNAGGVNVLRFGMTGRMVLGIEAVLPDGRIFRKLKGLRKDNTGYRLAQLLVGAEGTLGVVTAVTLELFPLQDKIETAFLALPSYEAALRFYGSIRRRLGEFVTALEVIDQASVSLAISAGSGTAAPMPLTSPVYILLEASTSIDVDLSEVVLRALSSCMDEGLITDAVLASSGIQRRQFWAIREQVVEEQARCGRHLRTDVSVVISEIPTLVKSVEEDIERRFPAARILVYGHMGDGNLHINVLPPKGMQDPATILALLHDCEEIIFNVIDQLDGSISAEHGIGVKKRAAFLSRTPAVDIDIMKSIKSALDPQNIMNPERIF